MVADSVWLPLLYSCMPDKQQTTYTKLYDMIDEKMLYNQDGPICFKDDVEVMMDFELAERNPWKAKWPSHRVHGCLFHYTQVSNNFFSGAATFYTTL